MRTESWRRWQLTGMEEVMELRFAGGEGTQADAEVVYEGGRSCFGQQLFCGCDSRT